MRIYDRAEEKNVSRWHEARCHIAHYWWDYDHGFSREDLRPFWEPDDEDSWNSYYNDIDINDVYRGKLFWFLMKLKLRSPRDAIDHLNW